MRDVPIHAKGVGHLYSKSTRPKLSRCGFCTRMYLALGASRHACSLRPRRRGAASQPYSTAL